MSLCELSVLLMFNVKINVNCTEIKLVDVIDESSYIKPHTYVHAYGPMLHIFTYIHYLRTYIYAI